MMGKYDKFIVKQEDGNLAFFTKMVANELAEANRLKIIELDLKITELQYTMEPTEHDDEEKFQQLMTDAEADEFRKRLEDQTCSV